MTTLTADKIIEAYIKLRDKRAELKAAFDEQDRGLREKQDRLDAWLLETMDKLGVESIKAAAFGTAFIQVKKRSSCGDWSTFWNWVADHKRFDMLEKRVSQKPVADYLAETGELPPAINMQQERTVTVRRT